MAVGDDAAWGGHVAPDRHTRPAHRTLDRPSRVWGTGQRIPGRSGRPPMTAQEDGEDDHHPRHQQC
ncbi:hypothetical protein CITRIK5_30530 [Citricoccus sp. K5]|nr:hypothetical protein CITRIK5_30530 [Citricoccus sp. K5]